MAIHLLVFKVLSVPWSILSRFYGKKLSNAGSFSNSDSGGETAQLSMTAVCVPVVGKGEMTRGVIGDTVKFNPLSACVEVFTAAAAAALVCDLRPPPITEWR